MFLISGIGEGDLVLLWTLFLRKYKGDFGPVLFRDGQTTALRRGHKEGRCNSLTQRGCLQKEPVIQMEMQADTGLGDVPNAKIPLFLKLETLENCHRNDSLRGGGLVGEDTQKHGGEMRRRGGPGDFLSRVVRR